MKITIHRGTHEIGGSCVEIATGKTRVILDIGKPLVAAEERQSDAAHGCSQSVVDRALLPEVKGFYERDKEGRLVDALFLSHAHLDHYGLMDFVNPDIPCYMGEGTRRLTEITGIFSGKVGRRICHVPLRSGVPVSVGDIVITPYLMDHSAFDAYAFVVESGGKKVIYTGDFRNHGRKRKAFEWFLAHAPRNAEALLLEGTMFGRSSEQTRTEAQIEDAIVAAMEETPGILLFMASGQNIDRLVSFYRACMKTKRLFVVDVYVANVLEALSDLAALPHPSFSYDRMKVFFPFHLCRRLASDNRTDLLTKFRNFKISKTQIAQRPKDFAMTMRPSMISDLSRVGSLSGGTAVYSMWEGYKSDYSTRRLLEFLEGKGVKIVSIHTSGHANVQTLKKVVEILRPKKIVPIHTFHPGAYAGLGTEVLHLSDGIGVEV